MQHIITGDARVLTEQIADSSVDLIFTDPEYERRELYDWLGTIARRILRPGGALLCWSNGRWHYPNTRWLEDAGLSWRWTFDSVNMDKNAPMNGKIICKKNHVIWMDVKNDSRLKRHIPDAFLAYSSETILPRLNFKWHKNSIYSAKLLLSFTNEHDLVFDPFSGSGTTPSICRVFNRNAIAYEINAELAAQARERLQATQTLAPVFLESQTSF